MMKPLKIAIVVHGRFHAYDLAKALLAQGHEVTLFTNYPKWAVARFGIDKAYVCSFGLHGLVTKIAARLSQFHIPFPEASLHQWFGRWAARWLKKDEWDVVHCWSGISKELLQTKQPNCVYILLRGSSHIEVQTRLLQEEAERTGHSLDMPSPWMQQRELEEYEITDLVLVLSTFTRNSFLDMGYPPEKVVTVLAGTDVASFTASEETIEARCNRICAGEPLRVLNVGTFSYRKGMYDVEEVIYDLNDKNIEFRFVGPVAPEAVDLADKLSADATFIPKQPHYELPSFYSWGDVFLLPTIEDGFQTVLSQTAASSLPIITTANGAGLDLVEPGRTGWVVPIREPQAIIDALLWGDTHREELAKMVRHMYEDFTPYTWDDSATDFARIANEWLQNRA